MNSYINYEQIYLINLPEDHRDPLPPYAKQGELCSHASQDQVLLR